MQSEAERIAAGLSEAQRKAITTADVRASKFIMPDYTSITMRPCGMSTDEISALKDSGLMKLPIRRGDYTHTEFYMGEILPLGLAVREVLMRPPVR